MNDMKRCVDANYDLKKKLDQERNGAHNMSYASSVQAKQREQILQNEVFGMTHKYTFPKPDKKEKKDEKKKGN